MKILTRKLLFTGTVFVGLVVGTAALFMIEVYRLPLFLWLLIGAAAAMLCGFIWSMASDLCDSLQAWQQRRVRKERGE